MIKLYLYYILTTGFYLYYILKFSCETVWFTLKLINVQKTAYHHEQHGQMSQDVQGSREAHTGYYYCR